MNKEECRKYYNYEVFHSDCEICSDRECCKYRKDIGLTALTLAITSGLTLLIIVLLSL